MGSKVSKKPQLADLGQESRFRPIPENPASQTPGPGLPTPLIPGDSAISGEEKKGQYPASPADPHQYTVGWEQALSSVAGVKQPVVVIWGNKIFVGYHSGQLPQEQVKAGIKQRIKTMEPWFQEIIVTERPKDVSILQQIATDIQRGGSAGLHTRELTNLRQRAYQ
ncbi:MAG: YhcN/YlaJ family sporulation lipoprotein [Carboxydocellales bacterium]